MYGLMYSILKISLFKLLNVIFMFASFADHADVTSIP